MHAIPLPDRVHPWAAGDYGSGGAGGADGAGGAESVDGGGSVVSGVGVVVGTEVDGDVVSVLCVALAVSAGL
ncbi:hypothetical protein AWC27_28845 [Mycobacterium szulgai]|uniref:Uncharacterized protein n=1 Tax=Mycobacterium szulgai TaxID=1787 RepID=A0A1X2EHJ8_MYCSZ|nr:hypothetical protein [Mycobacterium szulgai]ORX02358.1 hypothetical protein AWC27_28845 [Mycobacterium szulgai]